MNTTRFSDRAGAYKRYRPGYPPQAFEALFERLGDPARLHVADVGAGTGISSAALAERVAHVHAVEPDARMREQAEPLTNVTWHAGTAESTGLPDRCVDVAAAFQAFHWFDAKRAFAEFSRIARKRIAMLQYERDETQPFSKAYGELIAAYATDDTEALRMRTLDQFALTAGTGLRRAAVPFTQTLTRESIVGRLASSSYLPKSGPKADELKARAFELFDGFERDGRVHMAMTLHILTWDL
jgi:ubiquinone/menaquinone biosynthesis C-methylase UbiE